MRFGLTCLAIELLCSVEMARNANFLLPGAAGRFTCFGIAAGIAFWLAVSRLKAQLASGRTLLWVGALALRLAMLPSAPGDDIWRYRWEGRIQMHGENPYALAPDSLRLAGLRNGEWQLINGREIPAIYPPLSELIFAALERIRAPVLGYKILFALADLGVIEILVRLSRRGGQSPASVAWYAWNPLVVYVNAGGGHFDSLMVLGMVGAVACIEFIPASADRRNWKAPPLAWAAALLLGGAIAIKATPLVLVPVFALWLGWRWALCTLPLSLGITPLLATHYNYPRVPIFSTLSHFARTSRLNDAVWWLLDPHRQADNFCRALTVAICLALAIWLRRDFRRACLWVMGAAVILAPLLHAWYLGWVLPLAAWSGESARAWFVFSISMFGYFLFWTVNPDPNQWWVEPLWMRALIFLPPLVAFGAITFRKCRLLPAAL